MSDESVVSNRSPEMGEAPKQERKSRFANTPPRDRARLNPACVVCGSGNPRGLQLRFSQGPAGASAKWAPTAQWESFEGTIHGGIIGAVLDEAMSKAIIAQNWEALTVELRIRFRGRIAPGDHLYVHGWVVEKQRRRIAAEATLVNEVGDERAHAWGTFLVPTGG